MRKLTSLVLAVAAVGMAAGAAQASVMQLRMTADGSSTPDVYALTANDMARVNVRNDQLNIAGITGDQAIAGTTTAGTVKIRSLISFNLAGWAATVAPAGETIQINSVTLTLMVNGGTGTNAATNVAVRMSTIGAFSPGSTTWTTLGGTASTDIVPASSILLGKTTASANSKGSTFTYSSTAELNDYVSSTVNGSSKVLNLLFWNDSSVDGLDVVRFATETGAGAGSVPADYSPVFTIDYTVVTVPEAASVGMLGLGTMILLRRRR